MHAACLCASICPAALAQLPEPRTQVGARTYPRRRDVSAAVRVCRQEQARDSPRRPWTRRGISTSPQRRFPAARHSSQSSARQHQREPAGNHSIRSSARMCCLHIRSTTKLKHTSSSPTITTYNQHF
jgi:hypothetical protein